MPPKSRTADPPLVRQWLILQALAPKRLGATVADLAAELEVNPKTIRRDLENFRSAGFPLEEQTGPRGRKTWRLANEWRAAELQFTFEEALAMYLGRRFLDPLAGTLFWTAAQSAFRKIRSMLGPAALAYLDEIAPHIHKTTIGASDYSGKGDLIDRLMQAIEDQRVVFLTYHSLRSTEPTTYDIHPYGITWHIGSLYLVGFSPQHDQLRTWKIDRLVDATIDVVPFQRPESFDLAQHYNRSFGVWQPDAAGPGAGPGHLSPDIRVVIRFAPTAARYVEEKQWRPDQKLTREPDGALLAEFRLSSTKEIKSWILSFGAAAQVLEPESLREEIRREIDFLAAAYKTGGRVAESYAARNSVDHESHD